MILAVDKVFAGNHHIAQVRKGSSLQFPSPVKDGLVLWYDFMGRTNKDTKRGIAEDLSGNGNNGKLINFAHTAGSGYEDEREYVGRNLLKNANGVDAIRSNNHIVTPLYREAVEGGIVKLLPGDGVPLSTYVAQYYMEDIPLPFSVSIEVMSPVARTVNFGPGTESYILQPNVWTRLTHTQTTGSHTRAQSIYSPDIFTPSVPVYYRKYKLELGPTATPWRPAMDDPEYEEWAEDKGFRRSLRFDKVDDYILTDAPIQVGNNDFSMEMIVESASQKLSFSLFTTTGRATSAWSGVGFSLTYISNPPTLCLYMNSLKGTVNILNILPSTFPATHIVITREGDLAKVFVKGVLFATRELPSGSDYFDNTRTMLGMANERVRMSRIYNRALSPVEITHNYQIEKERWGLE